MTTHTKTRRKRPDGGNRFWRAVVNRDARFDAAFCFGVRSTGIYCRPSCSARRPHREQVVFFAHPDAAEQAGFRACRRCHPRRTAAPSPQTEMVQRACRHIEAHLEEPVPLRDLAAELSVSPFHLQRTFKRVLGISPRQYTDALRMNRLKSYLREGRDVTTALYEAGYGSSSRLYERVPTHLGMTPATYRRGGQGTTISYTTAQCFLGRLLLAATPRGICAIHLGDSVSELEGLLHNEYPHAQIHRDNNGLRAWVDAVLNHLEGQKPQLDLPLDLQGTAFQRRVWEALRAIPYGSTRSYGEVAEEIKQPAAVRAVAHACATNPVPLLVPCHRVIRKDGSLGGYRYGLPRKKALLEQECKSKAQPAAAAQARTRPA